MSNKQHQQP